MIEIEGPLSKVQLFFAYRGSSHRRKSVAWHKFDLAWLYRSPIPVGRRGYFIKWFQPAFAVLRGGGSAPCVTNILQALIDPTPAGKIFGVWDLCFRRIFDLLGHPVHGHRIPTFWDTLFMGTGSPHFETPCPWAQDPYILRHPVHGHRIPTFWDTLEGTISLKYLNHLLGSDCSTLGHKLIKNSSQRPENPGQPLTAAEMC